MNKFLIVGLGNIGTEYAHTRHNIGFDVVMAFVRKHGGTLNTERLAYKTEVRWKGRIFVCICPTTYMNRSGAAVKYWMDKEKVAIENVLVILDDLALPLSKLRLRPSGSDAGHNGLRDIQAVLNSTNYPRLRFGIGSEFPKGRQADFVLSKWLPAEEPVVMKKIDKCVEIIESVATVGLGGTMTAVNNLDFAT
ncbi:MAG: aminoacyl-tRNA hydrolase [Chitinophagaceae bacterium]|nr:MAG: aminoacyl-tRNA hydrolase [Chitinophagaceae bacterium]